MRRVLYGLTALINIALGLGSAYQNHKDHKLRRDKHPPLAVRRRTCFDGLKRRTSRLHLLLLSLAVWALDYPVAMCRFGFDMSARSSPEGKTQGATRL